MNINREIDIHKGINLVNDGIQVRADEKGTGGASHTYEIRIPKAQTPQTQTIWFQDGPLAEVGPNGLTNEVLLAILIDRLQGFQEGEWRNRENAIAITHLETALLWLDKRTKDREKRGVEGTSEK